MIKGLQEQIQAMQWQPSPSQTLFSNSTAKAIPIPSPISDHANEAHSPIPIASPSPIHDEYGTEEPLFNTVPTQVTTGVDAQMDEPEHQSMQHCPEIIHIDDSDEVSPEERAEVFKSEPTENPIDHSDGVEEILQ